MDLSRVLAQLRRELVHLDAAIASLERLQAKVARRGRPPRMLAELRKPHAAPEPGPGDARNAEVPQSTRQTPQLRAGRGGRLVVARRD
jgi:hypothetical protein